MIVDIKVTIIKAALYPVTILVAMVKSLNFISTSFVFVDFQINLNATLAGIIKIRTSKNLDLNTFLFIENFT